MSNWYTTREAVKRAGRINGVLSDVQIDRIIESVSRRGRNAVHGHRSHYLGELSVRDWCILARLSWTGGTID